MGNPIRGIESPASTALQVIEAQRLFLLVAVIIYGKAMPCTSNIYAKLCYTLPIAYCATLCLLCHNQLTICYTTMSYHAY